MAYLKPPMFTQKVFNRLAMMLHIGGSETLRVAGRSTGKIQEIPVIPLDHGGERYLVSPRGETEWVRNLRAAGKCDLAGKSGGSKTYAATEVPVDDRAEILTAYQAKAGKTVAAYFRKLPAAADHPVFRLAATS
ncbi:MAG: nitroreductase/quinone reductase family protein [Acidimicrobiia bacterium]